jgi:hypothetical protein
MLLPLGPSCTVLLLLFIAARVLISFLPCESWGPSGYICSAPYWRLPLGQAHTVVANAAIPEAARLGNRLDFLRFHTERFTLDARGYRNGPAPAPPHPKVILFGSSFSLGLALSDEETFSARLNQILGPVVYNAASVFDPLLNPVAMLADARASGMNGGWVIVEALNRGAFEYAPAPAPSPDAGFYDAAEQALAPLTSLQRRIAHAYALTFVSTLINMRLHDDKLLPNPFRNLYSVETLDNGEPVLVYGRDKRFSQRPPAAATSTEAFALLREALARDGYRLGVLLLPNAYSVYSPLLLEPDASDNGERYMAELAAQLAAAKIPVLNLLPPLRSAARQALGNNETIYYRDDSHWNSHGSALAAALVAPWVRSLLNASSEP